MTAWREIVPTRKTWYVFPEWDRLGIDRVYRRYDEKTHRLFLGMSEETYYRVRDAAMLESHISVEVDTNFVQPGAVEMQIALEPELQGAFVGFPDDPFAPPPTRSIVLSPYGRWKEGIKV